MYYITVGEWFQSYWWVILLIVLGVTIFLFLAWHFTALMFATAFKHKLRRQSNSINLLLAQRRETVLEIIKLALSHDLEISREDIKGINRLERIEDFQSLKKDDRDDRIFSYIRSSYNIIHLCDSSRKVSNDKRYEPLLDLYNGVEATYRQKVARYNSDVLGYNYWVRVTGAKIFFRYILRWKKKDLLV